MKAPILQSDRLMYKPLSLAHLSEAYVSWLNDAETVIYLESGGDYTLQKLEGFLREVEEKDILFWAIHINSNGKHIGNIKIDPVNLRHGLGEYGILMGDREEWAKGYAMEASQTIIQYCFDVLGLRKINLGVVEDNTNAVKLYRKLGFQVEGVYKRHGLYAGKYRNVLRMALFNPSAG